MPLHAQGFNLDGWMAWYPPYVEGASSVFAVICCSIEVVAPIRVPRAVNSGAHRLTGKAAHAR